MMIRLSVFFASLFVLWSSPALADLARDVRCESLEGSFWSCYVGGRFDQVEVKEQLSAAACTPGTSFGYDRGSIWVDDGCRAVFRLTQFGERGWPRQVSCESRSFGRTDCYVGEYVGVEFIAQLSNTECKLGYNWGYEPSSGYLWVNLGCRAAFSIFD